MSPAPKRKKIAEKSSSRSTKKATRKTAGRRKSESAAKAPAAKAVRKTPAVPTGRRRQAKPQGRLYWSISEVAELTKVKAHVLRYWETEFPSLKPKKNSAGNRHYRERDIELALAIKHLLYAEHYTIKGARQKLSETRKVKDLLDQFEIPFARADQRQLIREIRQDLEELRRELDGK